MEPSACKSLTEEQKAALQHVLDVGNAEPIWQNGIRAMYFELQKLAAELITKSAAEALPAKLRTEITPEDGAV